MGSQCDVHRALWLWFSPLPGAELYLQDITGAGFSERFAKDRNPLYASTLDGH
ncbi:MAG TPA: hypothetical protein VN461_03955 [Vicinamibacteria bacterium]|nr:hypothetical protein [Vicinamibacteria bacterium]